MYQYCIHQTPCYIQNHEVLNILNLKYRFLLYNYYLLFFYKYKHEKKSWGVIKTDNNKYYIYHIIIYLCYIIYFFLVLKFNIVHGIIRSIL